MDQQKQHKKFFDKHEWWFVALGLLGNTMFFVGSICFLFKSLEIVSIGFFIFGSGLMLVSSSAESLAEYSRNQMKQRESPKRDKPAQHPLNSPI
jgi:hypothetical protein